MTKMYESDPQSAQTEIAKSMTKFLKELRVVLRETQNATDAASLRRLRDAQAGVHSLVKQLTVKQMQLMKEGDDQQQSLLLGVLMTRQNQPMAKQLEVLKSLEFKDLPVVTAVLAANNTKTPLFKQVAAYLDRHAIVTAPAGQDGGELEMPSSLKAGKDGKPDVTPIVQALETRVRHLEASASHRAKLHAEEMSQLEASARKQEAASKGVARRIRTMAKRIDRKFAKEAALEKADISSLKTAVAAVRKGDVAALKRAMAALQGMVKAMRSQTGGFLVLIETAHRLEGRDCPYCAAQCVDKCHAAGKSYVTCLSDCADAGK